MSDPTSSASPVGGPGSVGGGTAAPTDPAIRAGSADAPTDPLFPAVGTPADRPVPVEQTAIYQPSTDRVTTSATTPRPGTGVLPAASPDAPTTINSPDATRLTLIPGRDDGSSPTVIDQHSPGRETSRFQGASWGDFTLGALLGQGGMGAVYHGRQISLDRSVAIKVLPAQISQDETFRARFRREAKAVAAISSPHVVQVIHAGNDHGHEFFVMELVKGTDLSRKLRGGWRPTRDEAVGLVTQAARGLAAAARLGIIHRDIKPANMLIDGDGLLKITDFGLARSAGDQELTTAGTIMGTVAYLSPEQARGGEVDQRSDLYSLGVVFFELLTGRAPFISVDAEGVIYQHLHEPPPDPRRVAPRVDADSAAVALRLLAKSPAARYQTFDELLRDLDSLAKHETPGASRGRRPAWLWYAVGGVAVLVLGGGVALAMSGRQPPAPAPQSAPVAQAAAAAPVAVAPQPFPVTLNQPPPAPVRPAVSDPDVSRPGGLTRKDTYGRYIDVALAGVPFRLRECPGGRFAMGSPEDEEDRARNEVVHQVTLRTFWTAETEVTQGQWSAVMGSNPSFFPGADRPVEQVARVDAQEFLRRLAAQAPGLVLALPTEPQWEYACRAGSVTPFSGGKPLAVQGWYVSNAGRVTHPVKQFQPNAWGLFDCHGNVAEWTADGMADYPLSASEDPAPVASGYPVIRGGAWGDTAAGCRVARRDYSKKASERIGFRFVASALPPAWTGP